MVEGLNILLDTAVGCGTHPGKGPDSAGSIPARFINSSLTILQMLIAA